MTKWRLESCINVESLSLKLPYALPFVQALPGCRADHPQAMALLRPLLVATVLSTALSAEAPTFVGGTPSGSLFTRSTDLNAIPVNLTPSNASGPLTQSFVSYSIEFAFFPDYAGNASYPNDFSNNLLESISAFSGTKPYIRVGGNTQ